MEILRGIRDTADAVAHGDYDPDEAAMRVASLLDSSFVNSAPVSSINHAFALRDAEELSKPQTCPITRMDGSSSSVTFEPHVKAEYKDEYTGDVLPQGLVQQAMVHEMSYFNDKVWQITSMDEALKTHNPKIVGGRWVLCNKGDLQNPKVRCRWVATKINTSDGMQFSCRDPTS